MIIRAALLVVCSSAAIAGDARVPRCGIALAWISNPTPHAVLSVGPIRFEWDEGVFSLEYALGIAKDPATLRVPPFGDHGPGGDVFSLPPTTDLAVTVDDIPIDGRHVHVTLWSREGCNGSWQAESFIFVTEGFLPGDANGDARLTASDALLVLRMATNLAFPVPPVSDVDGDGKTRVSDALCILRGAVGVSTASCGLSRRRS